MNYEPESEENRIDQTLRDTFAEFELKPGAPVWAGIKGRLGQLPPLPGHRPRRWLPVPVLLFLTAVLSGLSGWLLPHGGPASTRVPKEITSTSQGLTLGSKALITTSEVLISTSKGKKSTSEPLLTPSKAPNTPPEALISTPEALISTPEALINTSGVLITRLQALASTAPQAVVSTVKSPISPLEASTRPIEGQPAGVLLPVGSVSAPAGSGIAPVVVVLADSLPATLRPLVALEKQSLTQLPTVLAAATTADSRTALIGTLRAERHEILRLQRRTDSLLLALGDVLPANPALVLAARPDTAHQSTTNNQPSTTKKWSLLLAAAPEQNYLSYDAPARDELTNLRRNQETGRAGLNAALQAEYQASKRVSVAAGLGYSSYGAELRQAVRTTDYKVSGYDTTLTQASHTVTSTYNTYSIRIVQIPQLNPVFNAGGQVVRYDTVYVPRNDTLRSVITSTDVVHDTVRTLTPRLLPYTNTTYKTYRPDYRFLTLPFLVRYRLAVGSASRVWADVAAGAQLQFFLGGTQLVSSDGQTFHTETVGAGEGPFRALNVALTGSLNLNYALNPRLSVSIGPSLRWQAMSVFKPETGLRQQPTATGLQVGVRWKL